MREYGPLAVVVFVAALALVGVTYVPAPRQTPGSGDAKEARPADGEEGGKGPAAGGDFLQPFWDFARTVPAGRPQVADGQAGKAGERLCTFLKCEKYDAEFLIATVPDPVDSRIGYAFDLRVEALERALEVCRGAVLDRYWLPWQAGPKGAAGGEGKDGGADRPAGPEQDRRHEGQPGVLLFRGTARPSCPPGREDQPPKQKLVALFLVGETPTAGVHKAALTACLDCVAQASSDCSPIRILGPSYSGSAASLALALRTWLKSDSGERWLARAGGKEGPVPWVQVISGGATAVDRVEFQKSAVPADSRVCVTFEATVLPERLVFAELLAYLNPGDQKVAVLRESNTGFGESWWTGEKSKSRAEYHLIELPFPLHISQVRTAYSKEEQKGSVLEFPPLGPSGGKLPLPLEEGRNYRDAVPTMAPAMTAAAAEQVLARILSTISREKILYVGIVATDVRDKLFLANRIHEFFPDVRLFTTSGNLLFAHPKVNSVTRGMVVGSTYPLFSKNQRWSFPFKGEGRRLLFASQGDQGAYNAAAALLGRPEEMLEYGRPWPDHDKDGRDDKKWRPPVWISVVGRNSVQPVAVRDVGDRAYYESYVHGAEKPSSEAGAGGLPGTAARGESGASASPTGAVSWLWVSVVVGVLLSCGALGFLAWDYAVLKSRPASPAPAETVPGWLGWAVRGWPPPAEGGAKLLYLVCCAAFLATVCLVVSRTSMPPAELGSPPEAGVFAAAARALPGLLSSVSFALSAALVARALPGLLSSVSFALGAALVAGVLARAASSAAGARAGARTGVRVGAAVVPPAVFFLSLFVWLLRGPQTDPLTFERVTHLPGGLSPLLPAFFLGLLLCGWALCGLKRLHLLEAFAVDDPFAEGGRGEGVVRQIEQDQQAIKEVLRGPLPFWPGGRVLAVLVFALMGLALWQVHQRSLPTFEESWQELALKIGFALAALLLAAVFLRFHVLWDRVKSLLHDLALLPMLAAYSRLPAKVSGLFGRYLAMRRPGTAHLALALHQLRLVADQFPAVRDRLGEARPRLDLAEWDKVLLTHGELIGKAAPTAETEKDCCKALTDACRACVGVLGQLWRELPVRDAFGGEPGRGTRRDDKSAADGRFPISLAPAADRPGLDDDVRKWLGHVEDFVAMHSLTFLSQFFAHLRNLATFLTVGPLLLLLAVTSYPFQPQRLLLLFAMTLIGCVVARFVAAFVQMDRDEIISRAAGTPPHRVTWDRAFLGNVLTYVAPLLLLLLAQLGAVGGRLASWLEPVQHVLK